MTGTAIAPPTRLRYWNSAGTAPLAGGKVYFYEPDGSFTTAKDTFSDYAGNTANANPVILDANGEALIRLSGRYDVKVFDASDVLQHSLLNYYGSDDSFTVYDSITELKSIVNIVGAYVATSGYFSKGDGGGNTYIIETRDGSADDGGSIIFLDDGVNQARGLFIDGEVKPKQFGAKYDLSDDSVPISNALTFALSGKYSFIFNSGDTYIDSAVSKTVTEAVFILGGMGIGVSRVFVNNTTGGILLDATSRSNQVYVRDVEFVAAVAGAGTGLKITQPAGGNRHNRSAVLENVKFSVINENDTVTYGYFLEPLDITGSWRPYLSNVVVSGPYGPGISDNLSDTSPIYKTLTGINVDDCYGVDIHGCYIWSCSVGISNKSTTDPGPEGFRLSNTNIVEVKKALEFSRVSQEPAVWISQCHYNYRDRGIEIIGAKLIEVDHCYPYNVDTTPIFTGTPEDMYFDNTSAIIISNNTFHYPGNPNRRNISLVATTAADTILIQGNIFNALASIGISIGSNANDVFIVDNEYPGTVTTEVNDTSNSATIVQRDGAGGKMRLESGAASASIGPEHILYRNSESPANLDDLAQISFDGNNSAGTRGTYSAIRAIADTVTAGSEDSALDLFNKIGGVLTKVVEFSNANTSGDTAMVLLVNDGVSITTKRVTLGAAGSGGVGFKVLRVPN